MRDRENNPTERIGELLVIIDKFISFEKAALAGAPLEELTAISPDCIAYIRELDRRKRTLSVVLATRRYRERRKLAYYPIQRGRSKETPEVASVVDSIDTADLDRDKEMVRLESELFTQPALDDQEQSNQEGRLSEVAKQAIITASYEAASRSMASASSSATFRISSSAAES